MGVSTDNLGGLVVLGALAGVWYAGKYTLWGVVKGVEAISEAVGKTETSSGGSSNPPPNPPNRPPPRKKSEEKKKDDARGWYPDEELIQFIMDNENFRANAYPVPEMKKDGCTHAIGYGHNIPPNSPYMRRSITKAEARELLIKDLFEKRKEAKR